MYIEKITIIKNLSSGLDSEMDLLEKLAIINNSYQRLFLAIDSTDKILAPAIARLLAKEYKEVLTLKELLTNGNINNLNEEAINYFKFYCSDIISNYLELLDIETANNGNLAITTELYLNNREENLALYNFNANDILKIELEGVI